MNRFLDFIPAKLHIHKNNWEVTYYVINPQTGKMKRKRIRLNYIKPASTRRQYAAKLVAEINRRLADGWNPFLEQQAGKSYTLYRSAVDAFLTTKRKELKPASYNSYVKILRIFDEYLSRQFDLNTLYIYSIDNSVAKKFLRTVYLDNDVTERTYNNYRSYLITIWNWFIRNDFANSNPFASTKKMLTTDKRRRVIDPDTLHRIFQYLEANDFQFYLITLMIYYTLIRPAELLRLRRSHINFDKNTITVTADISKTRKQRTVTIPKILMEKLLQAQYHTLPEHYYLFSERYKPGTVPIGRNRLTNYWTRLRKKIDIPKHYQLYSLKDTGIVNMLQKGIPPNVVRDQAGHTSLSTTNMYIQKYIGTASTDILNLT